MKTVSSEARWEIERGPDWLFIRLKPSVTAAPQACSELASELWALLQQHFIYRLVVELDELETMTAPLAKELVQLAETIRERGGVFRLCGARPTLQRAMIAVHQGHVPNYPDRIQAVHCGRPSHPR